MQNLDTKQGRHHGDKTTGLTAVVPLLEDTTRGGPQCQSQVKILLLLIKC